MTPAGMALGMRAIGNRCESQYRRSVGKKTGFIARTGRTRFAGTDVQIQLTKYTTMTVISVRGTESVAGKSRGSSLAARTEGLILTQSIHPKHLPDPPDTAAKVLSDREPCLLPYRWHAGVVRLCGRCQARPARRVLNSLDGTEAPCTPTT